MVLHSDGGAEARNGLTIGALEARAAAAQPQPAMPPAQHRAGDIEALVQWALSQTGYLPWRNPSDEDLAMDHGWDVVPKATRALYQPSGGIALKRVPDADAMMVIEAIKALPPAEAAQVLTYGRKGQRPEFIADAPPRPVRRQDGEVKIIQFQGPKRHRRRVAPFCPLDWPVDPETICASHRLYGLWHAGMTRLTCKLDGQLRDWPSTRFVASAEPWNKAAKQAA